MQSLLEKIGNPRREAVNAREREEASARQAELRLAAELAGLWGLEAPAVVSSAAAAAIADELLGPSASRTT
ncbi:hypothetical protein ACWCP6_19090 [Streptomyces sp. NPDC002004]